MPSPPWIPVSDFAFPAGWADAAQVDERARWYCQQLEEGQVLFFPTPPFDVPEEERQFLLAQRPSGSRLHKNVSYRPAQDVLRGFAAEEPTQSRMHQAMRNYSTQVIGFLTQFLAPYAGQWLLGYASPGRSKSKGATCHSTNGTICCTWMPSPADRHGVAASCLFTNLSPDKPRVWLTTEIAADGSFLGRQFRRLGRLVGLPGADRSPYDRFMLRFHDYLKENAAFQADCVKTRLEFPPMGAWLVFSDGVPHAVLSGQFALEQTLLIPPSALVAAQSSPLRVLEALCGRPLAG